MAKCKNLDFLNNGHDTCIFIFLKQEFIVLLILVVNFSLEVILPELIDSLSHLYASATLTLENQLIFFFELPLRRGSASRNDWQGVAGGQMVGGAAGAGW